MKKLLSIFAGALVASAVTFSGVSATAGQIEGGDIYRVKNVTKGGDFTDPTNAVCGDTVQFKVRIHNIGAYALQNTRVSATLPSAAATSHSSMVTVSASNANAKTDTAGVNLNQAGKLSYVAGSTELLDAHNSKLSTLADGIVGGGVTLSDPIGVSTEQKRFVQFSAKVTCETPPKDIKVCELATKKVITIKENQFDAAKHSKNLDDCKVVEVKDITVCELATKKVITIKENQFDAAKHSKNLNDCKEVVPGKIQVCELATKKVITINENDFDSAKHSKDLNNCAEVLGTTTPTVIASTGTASAIATMFGLSSLAAGIGYAVQRRRNILG